MSPLSSSNPCNTGSTLDTSFYTGSRRDQITGDYQFGVRTYDPKTGSFLEPDTFLGSRPGSQGSVVSDPLTMNRYVYVNGDPLNLIDPSGHITCRQGSPNPNCDSYRPVYVDHGQPGGGSQVSTYHIPYATCNAEAISSAGCKALFGPPPPPPIDDYLHVDQGSVEDPNGRVNSPWFQCQSDDPGCGQITSKYGCAYYYSGVAPLGDDRYTAASLGRNIDQVCKGWLDYYKHQPANGYHWGVDIGMATNTPLMAPTGGTVVYVADGIVGIRVDDNHVVYLVHIDHLAPGVTKGTVLNPGDVVAYSGNKTSGGSSTGPHLHFEVRNYSGNDYTYADNRSTTSDPSQILDAKSR